MLSLSPAALELMHDAAIVFTPDDEVVLDVNTRACEVYGRAREQFVGVSLRELSRDPAAGEARVHETLTRGEVHTFHTVQYRPNGEELRLSVRATTVDFNGRKAILTVNRELPEAPVSTEATELSSEWQFMLDSIPAAVLLLDSECHIVLTNRRAFAMMSGGSRQADVTGFTLRETTNGEPWREAERLVRLAMRNDIELSGRVEDNAGGAHHTWSIVVRLASRGGETRAVVVISDLTAIVDLEAEVRRVEQMAEFGHVVAGVAHEVRTPLFALATTIELIEGSLDLENERVRRRLELMKEQIQRLNLLMRDLLEYGKAPSLEKSPQTLDAVVGEAVVLTTEAAATSDVTLKNEFDGDGILALIDGQRMVTALRNLIENATQHAPAGSTVTIRGGSIAGRDRVTCIIEDEGGGFPPQSLASVMEPFFTRRAGGTGLGLAIVQRIVELHGGRVTAENRAEGGARVTISLPCAT